MKKGKLLLSILAAAVLATAAGALVACSDVELPDNGLNKKPTGTDTGVTYTVTFNAGAGATVKGITGGGTTLTTDKNGKLSGTMPTAEKNENNADYTFDGWGLSFGATTPTLTTANFTSYQFNANTPVYAVFTPKGIPGPGPDENEGYTITFYDGDHGTVNGNNVLKTDKDGKVTFPTVTPDSDEWEFDYWDVKGEQLYDDFDNYVFTEDTNVTAHYKPAQHQGDDDYTFESCSGDGAWLVGVIQAKEQDWDNGGWGSGYKFEPFSEDGIDQLIVVVELQEGDEVKIRYNVGTDEFGIDYDQIENRADLNCIEAAGNNYKIKTTGTYTFKFKPDWESNKIYVEGPDGGNGGGGGGDVGEDDPDVDANTYYLIGSITQWAVKTDAKYVFKKTKDSDDGKDQYLLSVELKENDAVKIVKGKKTQWISSWEGGWDYAEKVESNDAHNGNLLIKANASYDIYLKVDKDDAESTSVWVSKQGGSGEANNDDGGSNFYLFGTIEGQDKWGVNKGAKKFEETELNINEDSPSVIAHKYKVEVDLVARDKVKIFRTGVDNSWDYSYFEAGSLGTNVVVSDTDLTVMTAGHYTFYLREYIDKTVGSNGYTVRVFFVAPAPAQNATAKINNINIPETDVDTSAPGHLTLVKWYKATGVQIADNTKIKIYVDGKVISVLMRAAKGTIIDGAENMAEEFTVTKGDKFEIHIKYYSDDGWKVWMKGEHDYSQTNPTPNVDVNAYYLVGTMTNWSVNPAATYKFTQTENAGDGRTQYLLTVTLNKEERIKIVKGNCVDWIDSWEDSWTYARKEDNGDLTILENGTYEIYLKVGDYGIYVAQKTSSGGNGGGGGNQGTDPNAGLATYTGIDDSSDSRAFLTGKFTAKGHTGFIWDNGYEMTRQQDDNNFTITVYLKAGDEVNIRAKGAEYRYADIRDGKNASSIEANENIGITKDGYYTFNFFKEYGGSPLIWIEYSATKPNGGNQGNEGGGGNQGSKNIAGYEYKAVNSSNYFLVGGFVGEDFDWNNGYVMKTKDNGEYMVEGFTVTAGSGVKIRIGDENFGYDNVHAEWGNKDWVEADNDGNIVFKEGGTYNIYINPNTKDIYISK